MREETGLEVEPVHLLEVFERLMPDAEGKTEYHYVLMDYICEPIGGTLGANDDASRVQWFTQQEIETLKITEGTPAVIAKGFHEHHQR